MKSNEQILNEIVETTNSMKDAMKQAQIEILEELMNRYDPYSVDYSYILRIINELKEELK